METTIVKAAMKDTFSNINTNLIAKKIDGQLVFCTFVDHDGNFF